MVRVFIYSLVLIAFLVPLCVGQTKNLCIASKPKPELPANYGTLDAVTSVIFGVEFKSDKTIGKVALILSSHIPRLDDLASEAVQKIRFVPKMIDGSPVTIFKMVQYSYSWEYGWRVNGLGSQQLCTPCTRTKARSPKTSARSRKPKA